MISCHPVKFGGHRHPNSRDMIVFVCCHWFSFRDLVRLLERHLPDGRFPNQTHPRWTLPNQTNPRRHFLDQTPDTSPTDSFSTRNIPDTHFPDQTHSWRTLPRPDTFPTNTFSNKQMLEDISLTRCLPKRTFPRRVKYLKKSFADNSTQGEILYKLNVFLRKFRNIVRDNYRNIHTVVILEI